MYSQAFVPTSKGKRIANKGLPSQNIVSFSLKIDKKGRIVIPAEIRNTLGFNNIKDIRLNFSFSSSKILVEIIPENGCVGVADRIGACGAPGPGSKPVRCEATVGDNPGRGLKNQKGVKNG